MWYSTREGAHMLLLLLLLLLLYDRKARTTHSSMWRAHSFESKSLHFFAAARRHVSFKLHTLSSSGDTAVAPRQLDPDACPSGDLSVLFKCTSSSAIKSYVIRWRRVHRTAAVLPRSAVELLARS